MAKIMNNDELRQQALNTLAQGRAEIGAEVHRLWRELSPARVMHRVVDRHTSLVIFLAFTAGIIPALIVFRAKPSPDRACNPVTISVTKTPPRPVLGALLMGALGVFAKTITPVLVKSAIIPHVLDFLSGKRPAAFRNRQPENGEN